MAEGTVSCDHIQHPVKVKVMARDKPTAGGEGPSLEDLMEELGEKMERSKCKGTQQEDMKFSLNDLEIEIGTTKSKGAESALNSSSLFSLLSKVADKLDEDAIAKDNEKEEKEESDIEVTKPSANSEDSLESLMTEFHKSMKSSDWLKHNTAEKWKAENPELAKEYMEEVRKSQQP